MGWLYNIGTRARLFLGFGLVIVLLGVVAMTAYNGISSIQKSQYHLYHEDFANAINIKDIRANQNGLRESMLSMLLSDDPAAVNHEYKVVQKRTAEIDKDIEELRRGTAGQAAYAAKLEQFVSLWKTFEETRQQEVVPLILAGKKDAARKIALGVQFERNRQMSVLADELVNTADSDAAQGVSRSKAEAKGHIRVLVAVGLAALLTAAAMALLLGSAIAGPLKDMSGIAERIASGDLAVEIPYGGRKDEAGRLARSFGTMVESLRRNTAETREAVNIIASSSSEILASITQLSSSTSETSTAVSETTTTVEEVKQTALLASQKSKDISASAKESADVLQAGRKYAEDSIGGMNRIREQMESIGESTVRLSEQSQSIGEITATVSDIAEQSNLLAVNAAIEAAKAGEYGKGFAVVAQEIKSMSEQSRQATAQVKDILADVQKAISGAVMAAEQAGRAVDAGVEQTAQTARAIAAAVEAASRVAQASTQIVASSGQQLVGTDQVALAMENIMQASVQNVDSTKQVEAAVANLHEMGQKLKSLVEQYRV